MRNLSVLSNIISGALAAQDMSHWIERLDAAGVPCGPINTVAMLANEAADAVQQGVADAAQIDLAMLKGANYPIGPMAWTDALGARWVASVIENLAQAYPDGRYRLSQRLRRAALASHVAN